MADQDELGSGQIERHPDRPIIHFGSPTGSNYHKPAEPRPNPANQTPMYRLTKAPHV